MSQIPLPSWARLTSAQIALADAEQLAGWRAEEDAYAAWARERLGQLGEAHQSLLVLAAQVYGQASEELRYLVGRAPAGPPLRIEPTLQERFDQGFEQLAARFSSTAPAATAVVHAQGPPSDAQPNGNRAARPAPAPAMPKNPLAGAGPGTVSPDVVISSEPPPQPASVVKLREVAEESA